MCLILSQKQWLFWEYKLGKKSQAEFQRSLVSLYFGAFSVSAFPLFQLLSFVICTCVPLSQKHSSHSSNRDTCNRNVRFLWRAAQNYRESKFNSETFRNIFWNFQHALRTVGGGCHMTNGIAWTLLHRQPATRSLSRR